MKIPSSKKELENYFQSKGFFWTPMMKGMIAIVVIVFFIQFFIQ